MPVTRREGAELFYEDRGAGEPPFVLVHGLGVHGHFGAQIDHFSRRHRVVAPDLPGFGRSEAPARDYSVSALAEDVVSLCDELGLRDTVIVGHSMGGAIAVEAAATHPGLASALVLLDPIPIVPAPLFRDRIGPFARALDGPGYAHALRGYAEGLMFLPTDDPTTRARVVDEMVATPQHVVAAAIASVAAWDGESAASRLDIPVLVVTPGDGIPSDMARTREVVRRLELGRTVGSGHFAHLLVPEQVNAMIERFLAVSLVGSPA